MSIQFFPAFNIQFHNTDGSPLSLGKIRAYLPDGVTPASTYNQNGEANSWPLILSAAGTGQLKGDDTITYTIKSYTDTEALVDTWYGVILPSSGGTGATVTMDTIEQGTAFKKITVAQYNALAGGANTTLHYHDADRDYNNLTNVPTEFDPSAHATTHEVGGSDPVAHDAIGPQGVASGVEHGHISDGNQIIYGNKRLYGTALELGDGAAGATFVVRGVPGGQVQVTASDTIASVTCSQAGTGDSASIAPGSIFTGLGTGIVSARTTVIPSRASLVLTHAPGIIDLHVNSAGYGYNACLSMADYDGSFNRKAYIGYWDASEESTVELQWGDNQMKAVANEADVKFDITKNGTDSNWAFPESNGSFTFASKEWATAQFGTGRSFTQGSAVTVWTITHNFGYYPVIMTWDSTGKEIKGTVQNVSLNQLTVTFATAQSGSARCV